jgi:hypothetical protein
VVPVSRARFARDRRRDSHPGPVRGVSRGWFVMRAAGVRGVGGRAV